MIVAEGPAAASHDIEDVPATGDTDDFEEMVVPESLESAPHTDTQPASKTTEWQPDNAESDIEPEVVLDTTETVPRPRKVAKTSKNPQRPDGSVPSNAAVAAACLDHLKAVGKERRQKEETQDTVYHFCMAAAGFLRSLPPDDQFDCMCSIQATIQEKVMEVRARRSEK
ncbi:uncharacterized protein LOC142573020 [Dermacentor variabilis]|uniref:uncharacterized protein LOC142573020 n=2 Tax=Dermacentor variabilis TaxID=34621 RepID=UPI003F5C8819